MGAYCFGTSAKAVREQGGKNVPDMARAFKSADRFGVRVGARSIKI